MKHNKNNYNNNNNISILIDLRCATFVNLYTSYPDTVFFETYDSAVCESWIYVLWLFLLGISFPSFC